MYESPPAVICKGSCLTAIVSAEKYLQGNIFTIEIPLYNFAGVAQSVERVALMKRQPQGRGFEPHLRLFLSMKGVQKLAQFLLF
jgi:hypothetical protein